MLTKKITILLMLLFLSGCAELTQMLNDPSFMESLESLNKTLASQKNTPASSNSANQQPAKSAPQVQYTDRPCENLTVQTKNYTNSIRNQYPNSNSNTASQCALSKAMKNHLTNQRNLAASCDTSGAYRKGLTQAIINYDQLISQLNCK